MKKTLFSLMLLGSALFSNVAKAQSVSPVTIGIAFHFPTSVQLSDYQDVANTVCQINNLYAKNNPNDLNTQISFYAEKVLHNSPHTAPKASQQIDIYLGQSSFTTPSGTVNTIWAPGLGAQQLAHEIGHVLSLSDNNFAPGNVMCQGLGCSGNLFDQTQINQMHTEIQFNQWHNPSWYWWTQGFSGLQFDVTLAVPFTTVDATAEYGVVLTPYLPEATACATEAPTSMDVIVTTHCPDGTKEHKFIYKNLNPSASFWFSAQWGVTSIQYIYYYPSGQSNTVYQTVANIWPYPGALCTQGGGDPEGKPTEISDLQNVSKGFRLVNTVASNNININNLGFRFFEILDLTGRKVQSANIGDGDLSIDVSMLPAGMYVIKATDGKEVRVERFIKK